MKGPVSAVEVEPVEPGVLDYPLGDDERTDAWYLEIHRKAKPGAVRPSLTIKLTTGVLVQVPRGPGIRIEVYQPVQGRRDKGIGKICGPEPINDRVEHSPAQLAHGCVGLEPLGPVVDFVAALGLAAFDEIAVSVMPAASIIQKRRIR